MVVAPGLYTQSSAQKALGFEETDSSCAVIVGTVNASRYQEKN
jgi:hypothetical protein